MHLRTITSLICSCILATAGMANTPPVLAQEPGTKPEVVASPPATAEVSLNGKSITIHYNSPRMRGRKIMGEVVPYGQIWRTGANPATTLITTANLKIGTLNVPAGTYTLFTLPSANQWLLIINKQTGQWGLEYHMDRDLGRTPLTSATLPAPQENMSISFEHTHGPHTELHIRWENADEYVPVTAQ